MMVSENPNNYLTVTDSYRLLCCLILLLVKMIRCQLSNRRNVEVLDSLILLQEISRASSRGWHDLIDTTGHFEDFFLITCSIFGFFPLSFWVKFSVVYRRAT